MKTAILFFFFFIFIMPSFSQLNVFDKYTPESGEHLMVITYFGKRDVSEKLSLTYFGLVNKAFGQALIGLSYSPQEWISIGGSIGIENGNGIRTGQSLLLFGGKHSLLVFTEIGKGRENYFYRVIYNFKVNEKITLGANGWRFHGFGPHFTYDLGKKLQSKVWISPLYDFEFKVSRIVVGTTIKI